METAPIAAQTSRKPLRLWPGIVAAGLVVVLRYLVPAVMPDAAMLGLFGGIAGALVIALWWVFFSRAPWLDRVAAIVVTVVAFFVLRPLLHASIAGGMMGMMFAVYAIPPVLAPVFVAWAVATRRLSDGVRRATMVATIFLGCGVWLLLRTDGIMGTGAQLHWRWTPTYEERLLADANDDAKASAPVASVPDAPKPAVTAPVETPKAPSATPAVVAKEAAAPLVVTKPAEWPGFRGPERDAVVHGVTIGTDWSQSPPLQVWRRAVGPGWSSFAVRGDRLYTQEQRGGDEIVACYRVSTGKPVWRHRDATRFWESNGGAGPRGTPSLSNNRVYAFGATGILNALDADNGAVAWSRNVTSDSGTKVPMWGFSSSPLVVDDVVIVAASGKLVAYDVASGELRWSRPTHGVSYSSPQLVTIGGVRQVALLSTSGATSVAPSNGALLWEYKWPGDMTVVQPASVDGDILVSTSSGAGGLGVRRLAVARASGGWKVEERWTSNGLKPYFNDYAVHNGFAYGFDGNILSCIDLADGTRKWKGGRYGNGQLVLLSDQDLLLVISEEGELALVKATPDQFTEVARFPALEGKTWNHPVIVRGTLLVRNDHEMAAFKLPLASR